MSRFRPNPKCHPQEVLDALYAIKLAAEALEEEINEGTEIPGMDGRCIALAMTKLEEAVMWAVKGVTA